MWDRDSPLRQIPHLNPDLIDSLKKSKVESVFDLLDMEDSDRSKALSLGDGEMADIARYANRYPSVEVNFEFEAETVEQGGSTILKVIIERDLDEGESVGPVIAPFYPKDKAEGWWLVLAQGSTLVAIKRTTLGKTSRVKLEFSPPDDCALGKLDLKLYAVCDSYVGVDLEFPLSIQVIEGTEESGSEEEED